MMAGGSWLVVRRRVRIMGRVAAAAALVPATRIGIARRAAVMLTAGPGRSRCADIRADGYYYFLDVPDGRYKLVGRDAAGRRLALRTVVVAPGDPAAPPPILAIDLAAAASAEEAVMPATAPKPPTAKAAGRRRTNTTNTKVNREHPGQT